MPDLDGFGVIENVEPSTSPAPVYVFVTAHDAHAIRAFEVHAVDYLLKPYDKERFAKALAHALQVLEQRGKPTFVGWHPPKFSRAWEPTLFTESFHSSCITNLQNLFRLQRFSGHLGSDCS